ncbi:MAG: 50S ribosomal protein L21 [Gammaproteobacteria bacterium]|nr:50S ribosomal protein L21 [Gammaproteobacteria bacterium]MCI0591383.1 50S ribosomal protein L21 [Gammaproteobacteria bacterium]
MYAIIQTGGKQYKVGEGDTLRVEKLEVEAGASVDIGEVLMLIDGDNVTVGTPYVKGAKVRATVKSHGRGPKVKIIKFHRRKHYRKHMGHRQAYTELAITQVATK